MKYLISIIAFFMLAGCETKYNIIDTGLANGDHDCSMYEYLKSDSYNWDSVRMIIDRAGLTDLFEGKREGFEQITFFGPVNHSVRRWMIENNYESIDRIPKNTCRDLVLRHVLKGKRLMLDDIPKGTHGNGSEPGTGGDYYDGEMGNRFWIYKFQGSYNEVPGTGSQDIYILSLTSSLRIQVASCNIKTLNGTVMSLFESYQFGTL